MKQIHVNKFSRLWEHTKMRIDNARKKAKNDEDFEKKMITRLMKIQNVEKVCYAIEYLNELGYDNIVDIYNSKMLIDELTN